jgi:protease-4
MLQRGMGFLRPRPVAVVRLEGVIGGAVRAADYVQVFEHLRERRRTRAVVVDIDSRGGSASASDYLYDALARLNAVKPVIAFCGNICASGGYLIACGARQLMVQPGAVVGSIGVISVRPLAEELMHRLGLDVAVTKSGRLKDMGAPWRRPTEEEESKEKALVDEYFNLFLDRIEKGRGMDRTHIRELATGEVFSGRQAVELGLADRLGTLRDAIELAAQTAAVAPRWRWAGPRRSLSSRLLGRIAGQAADEVLERVAAAAFPEPRF